MPTAIILAIIGLLPSLIQGVEAIFGSGTGAIKKKAVVDMATVAINAATSLSTGGQKHTFEKIAPAIGPVVDVLAGLLFPPDKNAIENQQPAE